MTPTEQYILNEISLWGENEILALLDDGFYPVMTDRGYKWLKVTERVEANERR